MFLSFKNKNSQSGFTLLELIVVIAIFLIITAVVMTDIPNFRQKSALDLTASEVATYIRGAQVYGAAQKGGATGVTTYSIKFTSGLSSFSLFKNDDSDSDEDYEINGFKIESILVDTPIGCEGSPNSLSIAFKVNDYSSGIGTQLEPTITSNNDDCTDFSFVEIKIAPVRGTVTPQCVVVYKNGQITPAPCS